MPGPWPLQWTHQRDYPGVRVPASGDSGTADGGIEDRTVADLASRRRPRTRWLTLAAAVVAGAVVGGAVVAGVVGRSDNDAPVLAAAELGPVPGGPEKARVALHRSTGNQRHRTCTQHRRPCPAGRLL